MKVVKKVSVLFQIKKKKIKGKLNSALHSVQICVSPQVHMKLLKLCLVTLANWPLMHK